MISTGLWLLFDFLRLKNDVKVSSKNIVQKKFVKKIIFWLASWRSMMKIEGSASGFKSGSISQRHGSADPDPDPHQNVMDPQHWYWYVRYRDVRLFDWVQGRHDIVEYLHLKELNELEQTVSSLLVPVRDCVCYWWVWWDKNLIFVSILYQWVRGYLYFEEACLLFIFEKLRRLSLDILI